MVIYRITNKANGKKYIGQTIRDISTRWSEHKHYARNSCDSVIYRAMRKHGIDSFSIEQVDTASTQEELDKKEQMWIEKERSLTVQGGYNQKTGGEHVRFDNKVRNKIRLKARGRKVRPEIRAKIAQTVANLWKNETYRANASDKLKKAFASEEHREKMSKIRKKMFACPLVRERRRQQLLIGQEKPFEMWKVEKVRTKPIFLVYEEMVGVWKNQITCCRDTGISNFYISKILLGKTHVHKGYSFVRTQSLISEEV